MQKLEKTQTVHKHICCSPAVMSVNKTDKHPCLWGLLFALLEDCSIHGSGFRVHLCVKPK